MRKYINLPISETYESGKGFVITAPELQTFICSGLSCVSRGDQYGKTIQMSVRSVQFSFQGLPPHQDNGQAPHPAVQVLRTEVYAEESEVSRRERPSVGRR